MGTPLMATPVGPTRLILIGTHGGAGTTTLVTLLDPAGSSQVIEWQRGVRQGHDRLALLVARSTAAGLQAASHWVSRWRPDLPRPGLLVVADAPFRAPQLVRYRQRALSSQLLAVISVPYLYPLRGADDAAQVAGQRTIAKAVRRLRRELADLPVTAGQAARAHVAAGPAIAPLAPPIISAAEAVSPGVPPGVLPGSGDRLPVSRSVEV